MHAWSARRLCIRISGCFLCTGECLCLLLCQHLYVHVCVCVCEQVTLTLPDQMCRSLDCAEWWVAPSLTLQTWNNAHRSLQLMSSLYREHTESLHSAYSFNQGLHIWGAELFMLALASDQGTWYKMQISIEHLRWFQFVCVTRWRVTDSLDQDRVGLRNAEAARLFLLYTF